MTQPIQSAGIVRFLELLFEVPTQDSLVQLEFVNFELGRTLQVVGSMPNISVLVGLVGHTLQAVVGVSAQNCHSLVEFVGHT